MEPKTISTHQTMSAEADLTSPLNMSLLMVMAGACGIFVANIYFNQPLLGLLQQAFSSAISLVNLSPTATQLGFACGLFFLIPFGDTMDRKKLILGQAAALFIALVCLASAANAQLLVIASAAVGISASVVQQIVPFAAELASPARRGRVIGTVMSGLFCGILLGRAVGGLIGDHFGWRATFWAGAGMTAMMWLLLLIKLPHSQPTARHGYLNLLKSLVDLWRQQPQLRRAACIQATLFGSFIGLWTILALYLQHAFGLGAQVAGLMGVVGMAGVLIAPMAGRIADYRGPHDVIGFACLIIMLSFAVMGLWPTIAGLVIGIILLDLGVQAAMISNQHIVYSLRPEARSRLNTLYMTVMFIGGSTGSWAASTSWQLGGWPAACLLGGALSLLGFCIHLIGRMRS